MRTGLVLSLLSSSVAGLVLSCSGRVEPPLPVGSGGVPTGSGGSSSGGSSSGGSSSGGTGGTTLTGNWTDHCELTPGSTEWGRTNALSYCYYVESFSDPDTSLSPPTFPEDGNESMGGVGGMGGAPAFSCPSASELDWSCQLGESRCCPTPQCALPDSPNPVNGQCCYIISRVCGV